MYVHDWNWTARAAWLLGCLVGGGGKAAALPGKERYLIAEVGGNVDGAAALDGDEYLALADVSLMSRPATAGWQNANPRRVPSATDTDGFITAGQWFED